MMTPLLILCHRTRSSRLNDLLDKRVNRKYSFELLSSEHLYSSPKCAQQPRRVVQKSKYPEQNGFHECQPKKMDFKVSSHLLAMFKDARTAKECMCSKGNQCYHSLLSGKIITFINRMASIQYTSQIPQEECQAELIYFACSALRLRFLMDTNLIEWVQKSLFLLFYFVLLSCCLISTYVSISYQ